MTIHATKKQIAALGMAALIAASTAAIAPQQSFPALTKTTTETITAELHFAAAYQTGVVNLSSAKNYLNIRSGAGTKYPRVCRVQHGVTLNVLGETNGWYYVSVSGNGHTYEGYASKEYIKITSAASSAAWTGYVKTSNPANRLNLRAAPSTSSKVLTKLIYGSAVTVISSSGSWYYVDANGIKGYVDKSYISSSAPGGGSSSTAVILNVPSFKQYDSRWASVKIGNKTIKQVGCLITSAAMAYSYKSGTTVYPDAMRSNLRFSNNDLYWSSLTPYGFAANKAYNCRITNAMMASIYDQLKAGKPVILGGKKSSGGTHYVVVTGYTGSSTTSFSASDFTINDPNSSNRKTLSDFVGTYPIIIRMVY